MRDSKERGDPWKAGTALAAGLRSGHTPSGQRLSVTAPLPDARSRRKWCLMVGRSGSDAAVTRTQMAVAGAIKAGISGGTNGTHRFASLQMFVDWRVLFNNPGADGD